MFISSNAGRRGFEALAAYSASKFGIEGLGQAMRAEMMGVIRVSSIQPGDVATELLDHDQPQDAAGLQPITDAIENTPKILDPEDVAASVLHVLEAPRHVGVNEILIEPSGFK